VTDGRGAGSADERGARAMKRTLRTFADADSVCRAAREELLRRAGTAIAEHGRFTLALSGGSTPKILYASLVDADLDWSRVHLFFGDERCVPPDDEQSNYRMAREALISKIDIPAANVHRIQAELASVDEAVMQYQSDLRAFFGLKEPSELPRFDLVLLGLGPDGHTASLFPGTTALDEEERLVAAPWVSRLGTHRITLTARVINHAACVMFLVAGADKAETLKAVLEGPPRPRELPSQMIQPTEGELLWFVDRAAGKSLADSN
jgi:6-phosphogluconolactonase